jgi:hypothetical protein
MKDTLNVFYFMGIMSVAIIAWPLIVAMYLVLKVFGVFQKEVQS